MKKERYDVEYINGKKFINGFLCNDQGKPITVSNGYSESDEEYAKNSYISEKNKELPLER